MTNTRWRLGFRRQVCRGTHLLADNASDITHTLCVLSNNSFEQLNALFLGGLGEALKRRLGRRHSLIDVGNTTHGHGLDRLLCRWINDV